MVINHLERLFVTSDTSTIVTELEVAHPAANLVVMAAKAQESEIGDGTNLVRSYPMARGLAGITMQNLTSWGLKAVADFLQSFLPFILLGFNRQMCRWYHLPASC